MIEFRYPTVLSVQLPGGKKLLSFSAPAADIAIWGGVPQKKRFDDGQETAGFQREDNPKRIKRLTTFLKDPRNTLQNPLLCAERKAADCSIEFIASDIDPALGHAVIKLPDLSELSLAQVFQRVQNYLEDRVPALNGRPIPTDLLLKLQLQARDSGHHAERTEYDAGEEEITVDNLAPSEDEVAAGDSASTSVLFEDSHISDFWDEIAARRAILDKIAGDFQGDTFLGFSRDALESYIRPVVVMDGQHRLLGAIEAAKQAMDTPALMDEIEARIDGGDDEKVVTRDLLRRNSRQLAVSLLIDPHPAEHVFQFIVVNQTPTPIGRALLGTIVSTSLSNEELEVVAERLRSADIPLEESRAASFMARNAQSPFANKVELGISGGATTNKNDLLPWPVFVALVQMFRDLKGGYLYHQKNNDFAKAWGDKYLESSLLVEDFRDAGFLNVREYWSSFEGPWRILFIEFWRYVSDYFGNNIDPEASNYWGSPRKSNLFNKISLNILAADYFRYLRQNAVQLQDAEHIRETCHNWLAEIDKSYFNRDWKLDRAGVKKDSPGIRTSWARTWDEYRQNPERLPRIENYRPSVV